MLALLLAYLYLSVSFIQMLNGLLPVLVFTIGCIFATYHFKLSSGFTLLFITGSVAIASFGELNRHIIGVVFQLTSLIGEASHLVLFPILLQDRGLSINPITTLHYIAPCGFSFLLIPWVFLERKRVVSDPTVVIRPLHMLVNASGVFMLSISSYLFNGKTSAITIKIADTIKGCILIGYVEAEP